MVLPLKDIENVDKEKGFRFGYSGLVLTIRGHEELFFEFGQLETRDDCAITLLQNRDDNRHLRESGILSDEDRAGAEQAKLEHQMLQDARQDGYNEHDTQLPTKVELGGLSEQPPIVFDDPYGSIVNFRPDPMNITCLTIGSRGDVQPFIALCLGLKKDGHKCKIATHAEFKDWIESYGIGFAPVAGDPAELMALCVEYGMFTIEFMKHTTSKVCFIAVPSFMPLLTNL
jgi:sterol 3beta-glucosyltransferase